MCSLVQDWLSRYLARALNDSVYSILIERFSLSLVYSKRSTLLDFRVRFIVYSPQNSFRASHLSFIALKTRFEPLIYRSKPSKLVSSRSNYVSGSSFLVHPSSPQFTPTFWPALLFHQRRRFFPNDLLGRRYRVGAFLLAVRFRLLSHWRRRYLSTCHP